MSLLDSACDALVREYLKRRNLEKTYKIYDEEKTKSDLKISNRAELATKLRIQKLMIKNKEKEKPLDSTLEVIVDYFMHRQSNAGREASNPELTPSKSKLNSLSEETIGQSLSPSVITKIQQLLFGTGKGRKSFAEEWEQGFFFNDKTKFITKDKKQTPILQYGLVQKKGGPCGVIASVQAFVLKNLLYSSSVSNSRVPFQPIETERNKALITSLSSILWTAGSNKQAFVVLQTENKFIVAELEQFVFSSFDQLSAFIELHFEKFTKEIGYGMILFIYGVILSRGIENILEDMDSSQNSLIGMHGYCTQELVNLLLTGKATSNTFDGIKDFDGIKLKGILQQSDIGYLSLFEKYNNMEVGEYFKTPKYPIWITYMESHFTILFCCDPETLKKDQFDLFYYDQLGNQNEEYRITISLNSNEIIEEDDLPPPLNLTISTKWKKASCDWNGAEPLL